MARGQGQASTPDYADTYKNAAHACCYHGNNDGNAVMTENTDEQSVKGDEQKQRHAEEKDMGTDHEA